LPGAGFRYQVGKLACRVISDGTLGGPGPGEAEVFGLNCLLIDSGEKKVLIDTGCGGVFQATAGRLAGALEADGIKCSDVATIIFTHGHIDHVGGSFDLKGRPVFPAARYIASGAEWAYWLAGPGNSELQNMFFGPARKGLLPARDRFDLIAPDIEVLPGVTLIAAPGHSPGNLMVDISSDGERLLCIGDIIHSQKEFISPEYLSAFDVAPEQALRTRARVLSDAAASGVPVFACHFTFPGLGHITRENGVLAWRPFQA
jgi:glyoxylase-like metal-dependent hydrolase (beta-lactamase superfamily II)